MKSRIISGTIAVIYLATAYVTADAEAIWMTGLFLILPLACIWYSEAVGGYTGLNFGTRPAISRATPGCFIAFGGWLLLIMPLIIGLIVWLMGSDSK